MQSVMKKYYSFMLIAAAAVAFISCEKEIDVVVEPVNNNDVPMMTITVTPTIAMTKTTLSDDHSNIEWSAYDKIRIFNNIDATSEEKTYSAGNPITIEVPVGTTEIYSQYPTKDNTLGPAKVLLSISNEQTQKNPGELAGRYYPMVAKGTISENNANMVFYPVAGALALNIWNSALVGTENVKSVTAIPYTTAFVGDQDDTDITGAGITYSAPASSLPIRVTLTNLLTLGSSKPANTKTFDGQIYVCMAKKSYTGIKFIIETDQNFYIKDASAATFNLVSNDFLPVNINLATCETMADTDFDLYSGAITEGDYIVYYNGNAMKALVSSNRLSYASVSPDANDCITTNDPTIVWHISASSTYWTFFNDIKQQYAASTGVAKKADLLFDGTDDKALWTFSGTGSYEAVNKANDAAGVNKNLRNNGTYGWACYAEGTGGAFSLYKLSTKTLSSIALSGSYQTAFYVDDVVNHDGLVVTATYNDDSNRDVTSDAVFTDPDMSTTGAKTVTVSYTYKGVEKTATYDITVSERPKFTVTFADDSSSLTEESEGSGVELPTRPNSSPWSFAGWAVANIGSQTTTAPAAIYSAGSTYYPTSNCTLYPVYTQSATVTSWTKVTDLSTVGAGTYALLTENDYAFNGELSSKFIGQSTASAFSFTDGVATSSPSGTLEITIAASGSGFTMYAAGKGYLYAAAAAKENLKWHESETSYWSNDNGWKYAENNAFLRTLSSDNTFRTYGNRTNQALNMARKGTTSVTYYISDPS